MESSWTGDQTRVPCIGRWSLIHWNTRRVQWVSLRGTRKGRTPRTRSLRPLTSITYEWYLCLPCLLLRKEEGQGWSMVPPRMTGAHSQLSLCPLQPSEGMALRHQQHGASISPGSLEFLSAFPGPRCRCIVWLLPQRSRKKNNICKTGFAGRF